MNYTNNARTHRDQNFPPLFTEEGNVYSNVHVWVYVKITICLMDKVKVLYHFVSNSHFANSPI